MMYFTSFIKIGSGIQKFLWVDAHTVSHTHTQTAR
jgi:hypothetical protein